MARRIWARPSTHEASGVVQRQMLVPALSLQASELADLAVYVDDVTVHVVAERQEAVDQARQATPSRARLQHSAPASTCWASPTEEGLPRPAE